MTIIIPFKTSMKSIYQNTTYYLQIWYRGYLTYDK